jgi:prepilin-type N-terminal cleavage/methylation domain-containing protein
MRRVQPSILIRRRGFTLVEVLVAGALLAIVLPAVMGGIVSASNAASAARHRDNAAGLAQAKLAEIIATGQIQNGVLAGDFGADWPDYHWEAKLQPLQDNSYSSSTGATVQEIDLQVLWQGRGRPDSLTVSTLVYQRASQ